MNRQTEFCLSLLFVMLIGVGALSLFLERCLSRRKIR